MSLKYAEDSHLLLMIKAAQLRGFRALTQVLQSAKAVIFFAIVLTMIISEAPNIFMKYTGLTFGKDMLATLFFYIPYTWLVYLLIPVIISKYIFRLSLQDLGLHLPKNSKKAFFHLGLALLFLVPWMFYFAELKQFQIYNLYANYSRTQFVLIHLTLIPLYYVAEEFFFRGFLFLRLYSQLGWHSYWITDIIFTIAHVGKPGLEILLCIPASIVLSVLTFKTRSIYPAAFAHTVIGVLLDVLVIHPS